MDKNTTLIQRIASNAIVAAIYVTLTVISTPFAYGDIQIRIAEAMVLLCFFRRDFVIGVTLGCLLANVSSTLGLWDVLIGTAATLASSLCIAYLSPKLLIAVIYPVIANGFVVAAELNWLLGLPFWWSVLTVSIGEVIAVSLGYAFFMVIRYRYPSFLNVIHAERHREFAW